MKPSLYNRKFVLALTTGLLIISSVACAPKPEAQGGNNQAKVQNENKPRVQSVPSRNQAQSQNATDLNDTTTANDNSVPLSLAVKTLGLQMKENGSRVMIGYSDVMYQVQEGQKDAFAYGQKITLRDAPRRRNGSVYMTTRALSDLLGGQVSWDKPSHQLRISNINNNSESENEQTNNSEQQNQIGNFRATATVDRQALIKFAKKFMGVDYEFGAAHYSVSGTFDCSSFTRYVFDRFGTDLPRLARDQGKSGRSVSRNELLPGDLVFFTVPGRFKSARIPGHVGIYTGNGQMIHTWGKPGVQISSIDNGYWSNVRLFMRRVL